MILVTGASGRIGTKLVRTLAKHGDLRVLLRASSTNPFIDLSRVTVCRGDVADPAALRRAFDGVQEVIHLAATMGGSEEDFIAGTLNGTQNIIQACRQACVRRLLYMSSLSVLALARIRAGDEVDESWPYEPQPEQRGFYTKYKLLAERAVVEAVRAHGLPACILRPGEVLDPEHPHLSPAAGLGVGPLILSFSSEEAAVPLVAVADLVLVMRTLLSLGEFRGEIIHIVDPHVVTQKAFLAGFGRRARCRVVRIPLRGALTLLRGGELLARPLRIKLPLTEYRLRSAVGPRPFNCRRLSGYIGEWTPSGLVPFLEATEPTDLAQRSA